MTIQYIRFPFAVDAVDKVRPPDETQLDNSVSFQSGYPVQYEQDPTTVGTARRIERDEFNGLMFSAFQEIQQYQQFGIPNFITAAQNGGTSFPYGLNATVRRDPGSGSRIYQSLAASNDTTPPGANWRDITDSITAIAAGSGIAVTGSGAGRTISLDIDGLPGVLQSDIGNADSIPANINSLSSQREMTLGQLQAQIVNQVFVSSLGADAGTLDNLDSTQFLRSDTSNSNTNGFTLIHSTSSAPVTAGVLTLDTTQATNSPALIFSQGGVARGAVQYTNAEGMRITNSVGGARMLINNDDTFDFLVSSTQREFFMDANGDFHADGDVISNSTTTNSDKRLKKDIEYLSDDDCLQAALQLMPSTFKWIADDTERVNTGFIAQDVQPVVSSAVTEVKRKGRETTLGLEAMAIIATLAGAIKSQHTLILSLQNKVSELSDRVGM